MATVVIHVTKIVAYRQASILKISAVGIGLALGPTMVLGSYVGKKVVDRLSERVFVLIIEIVLITAGLSFLIRG